MHDAAGTVMSGLSALKQVEQKGAVQNAIIEGEVRSYIALHAMPSSTSQLRLVCRAAGFADCTRDFEANECKV